jgi:hypothetical protein
MRAFAGILPLADPADPTIEVAGLVRGGRPSLAVAARNTHWAFGAACPDRPDVPARLSEEMFPARGRVRMSSHLDAAAAAQRSRPVSAESWRSNLGVRCFSMWPLAPGAEGARRTFVTLNHTPMVNQANRACRFPCPVPVDHPRRWLIGGRRLIGADRLGDSPHAPRVNGAPRADFSFDSRRSGTPAYSVVPCFCRRGRTAAWAMFG